jgi:hypothetical protein
MSRVLSVEPAFVTEMLEQCRTAQISWLPLAGPAGEQSLRERTPRQDAYPVALRHRQSHLHRCVKRRFFGGEQVAVRVA